jgi:predicted RNA binding protein YcfA (HicA-like mRNA interferase family)
MLSSRAVIRMLEEDGWRHVKTVGDHFQFKHPSKPGKVTVAHPRKDMGLKELISIERQSGLNIRRRG